MAVQRLTPALPQHVVEEELITELTFFHTMTIFPFRQICRAEFFRRLTDPSTHRFGRSASTWEGFLELNVHAGYVVEEGSKRPRLRLTLLGQEHLEGLYEEAKRRGVWYPA